MGSTVWTSIHQGQSGYSPCRALNIPIAETNIEPQYATISWEISQLIPD